MRYSKAQVVAGRIVYWVGMVFVIIGGAFAGLLTIGCLFGALGFLPECLFLDALIFLVFYSSKVLRKLLRDVQKYDAVLSQIPTGYIPDIAASLGKTEDAVRKDLDSLIRNKFFSPAYIDPNTNCIVFAIKPAAPPPEAEMVIVKCKNCGGINTIPKGQTGRCDYCDSPVKGK